MGNKGKAKPLGRRKFLSATGLGLAAGAAFPKPSLAQERLALTMVSAWPKGAPGVGINAERFAARLSALSGGEIEVNFHAAGELVPPFEALDAVARGAADLAHSTPYYWVGKAQALHYFTGVPFGLTAQEFAAWLYYGGGQELWQQVYQPLDVVPFYAGSSGTQAGGWFNREINSLDDLGGLKFRIAGLGGEVLRRLGVTPVLTPPGEIFAALATGAVDGADWVGPWNDIAFGLHKAAKYYYMPGFHEPGPSLEVIVNRARYKGLSERHKAIVAAATQATALDTLADFTFHNIEVFATLEKDYGVQLRRFPDAVVKRLAEVSGEVLNEVAASSPLAGAVHASYSAFLENARAYAPYAEQGVLNMRTLT